MSYQMHESAFRALGHTFHASLADPLATFLSGREAVS
jgi:hypothetical protein